LLLVDFGFKERKRTIRPMQTKDLLAVERVVELSRRYLLGVPDGSDNTANSEGHAVLKVRIEHGKPSDAESTREATKEEQARNQLGLLFVHGGLLLGSSEFGGLALLAALHASHGSKDAISNARWQRVGPLADGLRGDTYCVGSGCDRSTKQFNGASFKHDGR
jgi:hypothetical protein